MALLYLFFSKIANLILLYPKYISAEVYPGFRETHHEIMDRIETAGNSGIHG